jgi:Zn-dependent M28 family amino/carboxypeptidase
MDSITKAELRSHMTFLADDLLEGRGPGTRGHELAAKYVAAEFETIGLAPAGDKGTYFQRVPFREITVLPEQCSMSLTRNGTTDQLKWGDDFVTRGHEINPDASFDAALVFVGYGVVAPEQHYDDYAGVDAKGKVVVLLAGAPDGFPTEERAHWASGREKAREAAAHGAVGIIGIFTPVSETQLPWRRSIIGATLPQLRWLAPDGTPNDAFPQIKASATLSTAAAERLFQGAPQSWQQVWQAAQSGKLKGFDLPVSAKLHAISRHREISSPNVAGILRGSDPARGSEYVVFTAHTDHLGIGTPIKGDNIYNGAADDASGVSALIALARAFSRLPKPPARSLLFIAVTAEEKGLLGADYYAHLPTVPRESMVADFNFDGASVFYTFKDVYALGGDHTSLGQVVARNAAALGLQYTKDPMPEQVSFIRADHYSFVRQGIPSVTVNEGLTAKDANVDGRKFVEDWIATRYHSPIDDMNQPLNFDATIQYMQLNFMAGYEVANAPSRPTWNAGDFFGNLFGKRQAAGGK